jgi:hypothetical protein
MARTRSMVSSPSCRFSAPYPRLPQRAGPSLASRPAPGYRLGARIHQVSPTEWPLAYARWPWPWQGQEIEDKRSDTMTTPDQKNSERQTLDAVLAALGLHPDQEPQDGEMPDFDVRISGKMIGVEITMYQSGATIEDGSERRVVESEWEKRFKSQLAEAGFAPR